MAALSYQQPGRTNEKAVAVRGGQKGGGAKKKKKTKGGMKAVGALVTILVAEMGDKGMQSLLAIAGLSVRSRD